MILLQGGGVGLDAGRGAGPAGLGRPRGSRAAATERAACATSAGCCSTIDARRDAVRAHRERSRRSGSTSRSGCGTSASYRSAALPMKRAILARHGESEYSVRGAAQRRRRRRGRADAGRASSRRGGSARCCASEPLDLCVTSELAARQETADVALAGRDVPRLVLPELNDPLYGPFEGGRSRSTARWAAAAPSSAVPGRRRREPLRDRRALRARRSAILLERPGGGDPRRRALAAARLRCSARATAIAPGARVPLVDLRDAVPVRPRAELERAIERARAAGSPRRPGRVDLLEHCPPWSVLERIDDAHPRARADRAAAARCSASSPAAPTRPASSTRCASSATASRRCT